MHEAKTERSAAACSVKGELMLHRSSDSSTRDTDNTTSHVPATASRTGQIASAEAAVAVMPARYVLLHLATVLTGYSVKAMQRKIERGDWPKLRFGDTPRTAAS